MDIKTVGTWLSVATVLSAGVGSAYVLNHRVGILEAAPGAVKEAQHQDAAKLDERFKTLEAQVAANTARDTEQDKMLAEFPHYAGCLVRSALGLSTLGCE